MRTISRALLVSVAAVSVAAGCVTFSDPHDGPDGTPTPDCTPPTANDVDVSLIVADATAFATNPVAARFMLGETVLSCTTAMMPSDGNVELFLGGFGPMGGAFVELVLSSDADAAHTAGDLTRRFNIDDSGIVTPDAPCSVHETWDLAYSAASGVPQTISWELGTACPGSL